MLGEIIQGFEVTLPQLAVISLLAEHGEQKVSELSQKMGLSDSTVSGILDRLEKQNIVQRERSTKDRRVVNIALGAGSERIHKDFMKLRKKYFTEIYKEVSDRDIDQVIEGLKIFIRILESERP